MRLLAVDFGGVRIGLAVGSLEGGFPRPLPTLQASGTLAKDAAAIAAAARRESAELIVLGVPLNEDGETKMSHICRKLGEKIVELGLPVEFVDEALTSYESEALMKEAGLKGSQIRKKVDGEAAVRILERWRATRG